MNVLLLRPVPANERFGLGPFFRIEPLGIEYIAAALEARGHAVTVADLRFSRPLAAQLRAARPDVVGIAAMHALETDEVVALAREVHRLAPDVPIVVGGHTAAAYPEPFLVDPVAAIVVDDGERTFPLVCEAIARRESFTGVPGLTLRHHDGTVVRTAGETGTLVLDEVPLPARHHVAPWRRQYACLAHRPAWLIETARGCPFRCSFCSIWQLHQRAVRERSIDAVCRDFESVGDHIFVADDLFWHHPSRSLELARELPADFDIFFGLEAATDEGLDGLTKDATVAETMQGVGVAREHKYGVTGNFVVDPAWTESDFEKLWAFVERHQLFQAGFTILTPLPGTKYFDDMRQTLRARRWSHFDMHHLLWEPRLGPRRFFELYCETWRRSVLNLKGRKGLVQWMREVDLSNALFLIQALRRTQKMMDAEHYMKEYDLAPSVDELLGESARRSLALPQVPRAQPGLGAGG
ncbi:MAG: cobalamin-dependent protein [Acidobacteria bacterium]|nr:cobalamin-dependent protein [Acidobacteriota bacterium]